jgi:hypothetical protein
MKLIYVFSLLDNLHVSAAWFEPVAGQEATVRLYQRASEAKDHTHTYQVATGQLLSTTGLAQYQMIRGALMNLFLSSHVQCSPMHGHDENCCCRDS